MRTKRYIVACAVCLGLLGGCVPVVQTPPPPPQPAPQPKPLPVSSSAVLRVGDTGRVGNVVVTLNSVTGDSRCAIDVQCIWEGEVILEVTLSANGQEETKTWHSRGNLEFGGQTLTVTNVEPAPRSGQPISANDYVVTINVR